MAAPTTERTPTGVRAARARLSWSDALQGVVLTASLIALDLLPLYALLLIAAGHTTGNVDRVALPLGYLIVTSASFVVVGRLLRRLPPALSVLAGAVAGVVLLVIAVAISPAAYGDTPGGLFGGGWMERLVADLGANAGPFSAVVALGLVVLALGFRGVALGREPPELDSVLTLFKVSVGAIVFFAILAVGLPPAARATAEGALGFMLPLDVFAGLLASALSRAALNRETLRGADPRTSGGERWLAMAVALSGAVVVVSLLISSIFTFGSVSAGLAQLGPVGAALNALLDWVISAIALLLFFLLGPLIDWLHQRTSRLPPQPTATPRAPVAQPTPGAPPHSVLPDQWLHLAEVFLALSVVLLIVLVSIMILRLLLGARQAPVEEEVAEEREALDGSSLLQAQLRALLDRFRRHPELEEEESLPAGSVRALYRELLRVAASRGIARRAPETPDEYGRRLGATLASTNGTTPAAKDVGALGEAYDAARYGDREPAEEQRQTLRERSARIMQALRRRAG